MHNGHQRHNGIKVHTTPINYHLIAAQQKPYQKASLLTKTTGASFGERKVRNRDDQKKKDKTERATGLGRRTREESGKGNQINDNADIPDGRATPDI